MVKTIIDKETEKKAKKRILNLLRQRGGKGWTNGEIVAATGLSETMVSLYLSKLCQDKQVKCLPRSHAAKGLRAEYWPI